MDVSSPNSSPNPSPKSAAPVRAPAPTAGSAETTTSTPAPATPDCVEHGIWTPLPIPPPTKLTRFTLRLRAVNPREHQRIKRAGRLTFHLTGCAGAFTDHAPQHAVAHAMAAQARDPALGANASGSASGPARKASFLYHLGDIVYKDDNKADQQGDDQRTMYNDQFYRPYTTYPRRVFAIAGNHDGKLTADPQTCAIEHFLANFCAHAARRSPDNTTDRRPAMIQPYPYWRLTTPLAYLIGVYTNIANGGLLDDPAHLSERPQYAWLVAQLQDTRRRNARAAQRHLPQKAILLALHYPPYSGTTNFTQRGDPTLGPSNASHAQPLAQVLRQAFAESGQRPDAVFSAHAHLYQRLTYRYADGWEIPYLVVGNGGHGPVESMWKACDKTEGPAQQVPFDAVLPPGDELPAGERVRVVAFDDQSFGFARITIAGGTLTGEYFAASPGPLALADSFTLDLAHHHVV